LTKVRLRHFATVFWFKPYRAAKSLSGAFDRCIAARIACVVVAAAKYLAHIASRNVGAAWLIPLHSGTRQLRALTRHKVARSRNLVSPRRVEYLVSPAV
jgi:hypothetical protein